MRFIWLVAAVLFTLGAQDADQTNAERKVISPEVREAAARLSAVVGSEDLVSRMMELMKGQIAAAISKQNPNTDGQKVVDEIIMPEIRRHTSEMTDLVIEIWASHFDQAELEQLRAFYETPTGQKALRELPRIYTESQRAGATWGQNTIRDIFRRRGDDLREMGVAVPK